MQSNMIDPHSRASGNPLRQQLRVSDQKRSTGLRMDPLPRDPRLSKPLVLISWADGANSHVFQSILSEPGRRSALVPRAS